MSNEKSKKTPVGPPPPLQTFELGKQIVAERRFRWAFYLGSLFMGVTGIVCALLMALRPMPVVVRTDNPYEPARVVYAFEDQVVREIDAKRFFMRMADRLHGWNSATVLRDLGVARTHMTQKWKKNFLAEMAKSVDVPVDLDASGRMQKMASLVAMRVRSHVSFDSLDDIECKEAEGKWHCFGRAKRSLSPLMGNPNVTEGATRLNISASFVEVLTTRATVDGLLIDFWNVQEES